MSVFFMLQVIVCRGGTTFESVNFVQLVNVKAAQHSLVNAVGAITEIPCHSDIKSY